MHQILWGLLAFWGLNCGLLRAQRLELRHFDLIKGQSSSEIYDLHLGEDGVLWFGSPSGLSRFDGYNLNTFTTADGLDDNEILKIFSDSRGRLWLSTYSDRINCYDHGGVRSSRNDPMIGAIPESRVYRTFLEERDGSLWLAGAELVHFSPDSGMIKVYHPENYAGQIMHLKKLGDGVMQVYYRAILKEIRPEEDVLVPMRPTRIWLHQTLQTQMGNLILVGTEEVVVVAPEGERRYNLEKLIGEGNGILTLTELSNGRIVLCTTDGALVFANDDFSQPPTTHLAVGHPVSDVVEDREGLRWVSTLDEGIFLGGRYNILSYSAQDGVPIAYYLHADQDGKVWVGGGNGTYYTLAHGKMETFQQASALNYPGRRKRVLAVVENPAGGMFVGGDAGLSWTRGDRTHDIDLEAVKSVIPGPSGRIWVACPSLKTWDPADGTPVSVRELALTTVSYPVFDMKFDNNGQILIASKYGLLRWRDEAQLLRGGAADTLLRDQVTDIVTLGDHLWLSLGAKGAALMLPDTLIRIGTSEGLSSNLGTSIAVRNAWEAWLGTRSGLNRIRINPSDLSIEIIQIDELDGLIGDEINEVLIARDTVWAATSRGVSFFAAEEIADRALPPVIQLKKIVIGEKDTLFSGPLDLHHSRSSVQFQLFSAGYTGEQPPHFRYRMKGLDQAWQTAFKPWIRYSSLPPGSYEFEVYAQSGKGKRSSTLTLPVAVVPPWWARTWGIPLIIFAVTLVLLVIGSIYLRNVKRRLQWEMQVLLAEQKALRAQMNPHFLFNALNAIQGFFMRQKMAEGNQYLKKFSSMIRRILENSDKTWVTISEELEVIRPYMEFEHLRSGKRFDFELVLGPGVNVGMEEMPAMLVQPLLENAVWHGIQHKPEHGHIFLRINKEQDTLIIVVEDDGVGRAAAREIEGERSAHRSMGLQLIRDRIKVAEKLNNAHLTLEVVDLGNGKATGTQVILTIKRKS